MEASVLDDEEAFTVDRTSWPINRLSYIELSAQDTLRIQQLFHNRSDAPVLTKWVMLHKCGSKFRPRLVVVSALRLWVLKHKKTFSKALILRQEYQLMRVQNLVALRTDASPSTVSLQLVFIPKGKSKTPVMLHFDPGVHTEQFVRLLQRQLHALRLTLPLQQMPPVNLPPECHWHECFSDESDHVQNQTEQATSGVASQKPEFAAMAMTYHAFCDDLGIRFRDSIPARLEECAATSKCMDFQYCLGFPAGVDTTDHVLHGSATPLYAFACSVLNRCFPRLVSNYQSKEIQALARTLECLQCFSDIIICDLALGQASLTTLFQTLLSPLCTIVGFTLTNVQLSVRSLRILQQIVLESTMRQTGNDGTKVRLQRLDFSFNRFTLSMATELATILQLLPNGLEYLQLERCGLTTVSCCRVLDALTTSSAFAASLLELNIANNYLGLEGTKALALWITGTSCLQRLDVSRTQLDINTFVEALKHNTLLHESSLQQLDLSYNQMRTQASEDLGTILGTSQSLATLFLRGMKRYRYYHKLLPSQLQREGTLLALSEAAMVAQTAAVRRYGGTGQRADGLRKHFLGNILGPMFANSNRSNACMVDLSENDLSGRRAEILAQLLDDSPWSTRLSLRLDHTRLHDKSALLLLHAIRECKTLDSLSLEGNGFIKRQVHCKRQRQTEMCYKDGVAPSEPSIMEQAGANALALLLGGPLECDNNQLESWLGSKDTEKVSAAFSGYPSASKPLRLKELCLKSEGSYVFGTHIITAAIQALDKPFAYLTMLDVTGNECGDALTRVLGQVLPKNRSLQALFWDGNWVTVDGYFQFYDGLVQNYTLLMVQMPIQDTRRILEELKDPPREKLFGILGKIFKATERNQILQNGTKEQKAEGCMSQTPTSCEQRFPEQATPEQDRARNDKSSEGSTTTRDKSFDTKMINELEATGLALQQCRSPKLATIEDDRTDNRDVLTRMSYSKSTSARYPSSMQSWSMQSSTDDFRSQLKKLDLLTASVSLSSSRM